MGKIIKPESSIGRALIFIAIAYYVTIHCRFHVILKEKILSMIYDIYDELDRTPSKGR